MYVLVYMTTYITCIFPSQDDYEQAAWQAGVWPLRQRVSSADCDGKVGIIVAHNYYKRFSMSFCLVTRSMNKSAQNWRSF